MPELPSDPPQLVPRINSESGISSHRAWLAQGKHFADELAGRFDGLGRAADVLHAEHVRTFGRAPLAAADLHQLLIVKQVAERGGFATQADQHVAADVGMAGDSSHHPIERGMPLAAELHSAAAAVREGHHAVDIGKLLERLGIETGRDILADRGRAIDRRDYCDVIARAGLAVGPPIALKGAAGERRRVGGDFAGGRIVAGELAGGQVVCVNPRARRDRFSGEADDLAVLDHRFVGGNRIECDFVAEFHRSNELHRAPAGGNLRLGRQIAGCHTDVVVGVQVDAVDRFSVEHRGGPGAGGQGGETASAY